MPLQGLLRWGEVPAWGVHEPRDEFFPGLASGVDEEGLGSSPVNWLVTSHRRNIAAEGVPSMSHACILLAMGEEHAGMYEEEALRELSCFMSLAVSMSFTLIT